VLPDGRIATGGDHAGAIDGSGGRVLVWDPDRAGGIPVELGCARFRVEAVAVLPDGRIVTGGSSYGRGRVLLWDLDRAGVAPIELGGNEDEVEVVAVLPDGRIVTGGSSFGGGRVLVWDPDRAGADPIELGRDEAGVEAVAVLPDGRIVVGADGWLRIYTPSPRGFVLTSTAACAAEDVVLAGGTGEADLVVLHQGRRAWSGWALPLSPAPRQG
jgi:WD40 repeat protein